MHYEYRIITDSLSNSMDTADEREEIMNRMGAQGWQLFQDLRNGEMIFFREKPSIGPSETKEQ